MLAVVDLVAEEDGPPIVAEEPDAVVGRLAGPEVEHGEASAAELERLPVRDGAIGERALARPLLAEHGRRISSLTASSRRITASTPAVANTGT